jgi:hypothetical protein
MGTAGQIAAAAKLVAINLALTFILKVQHPLQQRLRQQNFSLQPVDFAMHK